MILHMKRAAFTFFFLMFALLLSTLAGATQESHFESGTAPFVWKKVADGFEFTEGYFASLLQDETVSFEAVRIDLGLFREAVLDARDFGRKAMTAEEFVRRSGAAAAINGGFFMEHLEPLGLIISGGVEKNKLRKADWGVFLVRRGKPEIIHTRDYVPDPDISEALQVGPRLVISGAVPPLKKQVSRRSALGITRHGRLILLTTRDSSTKADALAEFLSRSEREGGLDCLDALNLDGGPSSQFSVHWGDVDAITPGGYGVPNCVAVFPRNAEEGPVSSPPMERSGKKEGTKIYSAEDLEILRQADEIDERELSRMTYSASESQRAKLLEMGRQCLSVVRSHPLDVQGRGTLFTDLPKLNLGRTCKRLEEFDGYCHRIFRAAFPKEAKSGDVTLFVFSDEKGYRCFSASFPLGEGQNIEGFYHPATRIIGLSARGVGAKEIEYGIFHEYAHSIVSQDCLALSGEPPFWLDEGLAMLAACTFPGNKEAGKQTKGRDGWFLDGSGRIFLNPIGRSKLRLFADRVRRGNSFPLGELIRKSDYRNTTSARRQYDSLAACFFLYSCFDRPKWMTIDLPGWIASGFQEEEFSRSVRNPDVEKAFRAYVLGLDEMESRHR
jgi:uncharacterized protein YigE (DUF2233 family)